jgi:hypothetical protein
VRSSWSLFPAAIAVQFLKQEVTSHNHGLESKTHLFCFGSNLNSPIFLNDQMSCSNWNSFNGCDRYNHLWRWTPSIWHLKTNARKFSIDLDANAQILSLSFLRAYSSRCGLEFIFRAHYGMEYIPLMLNRMLGRSISERCARMFWHFFWGFAGFSLVLFRFFAVYFLTNFCDN